MTTEQEDDILCSAITNAVNQCKTGNITTAELVRQVQDIIDCGKALDQQREKKENGRL